MCRGFEFHLTEIMVSSSAGRAIEKTNKSCMVVIIYMVMFVSPALLEKGQ